VKHEVTIFRVHRNQAGSTYPFDKTYFFRKEDKELLGKIFPNALVLYINKAFINMVKDTLKESKIQTGKVYPMRRSDEDQLKARVRDVNPIQTIMEDYKKYLAVIPILYLGNGTKPLRYKEKGKTKEKEAVCSPAYLHASAKRSPRRDWKPRRMGPAFFRARENIKEMMKDVITGRSFFLADGEEYRPVCSICSNSLAMIAGQCVLGGAECIRKLAQTKPSHFRKNMQNYKTWVSKLEEPDIQVEEAANE